MVNNEKIGVGVITCNRETFLKKCFNSLTTLDLHNILDEIVIINDGLPLKDDFSFIDVIQNDSNLGVAKSKNKALQYLLDAGCDHIFLIEDDMIIKDQKIFGKYIEVSKISGIQHMMFGYHGPANKNGVSGVSGGVPCPRLIVKYSDDISIALNQHCVGAFCYYTRKSLEDCGLIDEGFKNAFDHVSHSYTLALKGYSTPYWWWADLANSCDYIEEQACSEVSSTIVTPENMYKHHSNIRSSIELFRSKFGVAPFGKDGVSDTPEVEVLKFLKSKL